MIIIIVFKLFMNYTMEYNDDKNLAVDTNRDNDKENELYAVDTIAMEANNREKGDMVNTLETSDTLEDNSSKKDGFQICGEYLFVVTSHNFKCVCCVCLCSVYACLCCPENVI